MMNLELVIIKEIKPQWCAHLLNGQEGTEGTRYALGIAIMARGHVYLGQVAGTDVEIAEDQDTR